ncbi:MAG: CBASS cGAMP-activated phospholipase [Rhodospirillaceae bacterium]
MRLFRSQEPSKPEPRSAGTRATARVPLPWPNDRDFRILSIDGGGIRGILPLAFLAGLESTYLKGDSIADYFDLIVGTSTGGIIALGLSSGKTAAQILDIYVHKGGEVFPPLSAFAKVCTSVSSLALNRCNTEKLGHLVDAVLGQRRLWESTKRLCIPSAETQHFEPYIFKTPHHPDYKRDWREAMAHIALSTSAAPSYFKSVQREDRLELVDGGIWANNPIMVGVADALSCFRVERKRVKVLSLGCVKDAPEMTWARRHLGGLFFWRTLMFESMHIQSHNVLGQAMLLLGHENVVRVDSSPVHPALELSDWVECKERLPPIANALLEQYGAQIRASFLTDVAEPFLAIHRPPAS